MGFGGIIFNFIGAVTRWVYGTIWRTLAHKKKYTFQEYMYGPKNSDDYFDAMGHTFINKVIGAITLVLICILIGEYF